VAYLQAVLEQEVGSGAAAVESALRALAIIPGHPRAEALLAALTGVSVSERSGHSIRVILPEVTPDGKTVPNAVPTLWSAALTGAALLHPFGSLQPLRPTTPPRSFSAPPPAWPTAQITVLRRRWLLALGLAVVGLAAIRDPILGGIALALTVGWLAMPATAPTFPE